MDCKLKKLSVNDGYDIFNMLQEIPKDENGFINNINGLTFNDYKKWLIKSDLDSKKTEIEDGWKVPQSIFWFFVDDKPVGMGKIRHFLTDRLLQEGGTLGYTIIPDERNKGYGTILLRELLKEANYVGFNLYGTKNLIGARKL
jgi:predicted acetyltransferase